MSLPLGNQRRQPPALLQRLITPSAAVIEASAPPASARWLRGWAMVVVAMLTVITLATPFMEAMPASHHVAVPAATAVMVAAWIVELANVHWPRPVLIAAVVLPNVWLTLIGHTSTNYLFLSLLVSWVGVVGTRAEGSVALALSLATVGGAAVLDAISGSAAWWSSWVSWSAGLVMAWLMALVLGRQERLVTELRRLAIDNARLQERSRQAAVLEERQRLARELHDSVTQALYGISLYVEAAARAVADGEREPAAASLREIRETTQEAQGEMRLLLFEMRPPLLEEHGLAAALRSRLQAVEARRGLTTDFDCQGEARLPPVQEQELYRLAQEALNNVLKHAHAQHVRVRLAVTGERVTLEVADDGIGFEPSSQEAGAYGLPGMRERAQRLGGTLRIDSAAGAGTRVCVEVPR